ncbi:MAG: hypothetical protein HFH89_07025 [Lachnospiraceae bacterium]|nr:LPD28 domain-containing protein [uncultured Acetatifactor sp.]MCI8287392.1 hypothetical protein [Lachnospiraceae bacterium]
MARYDAMKERFDEILVLGKPALFLDLRIDRDTVPKGLHLYEVRHGDDKWSDPVQIAKGIVVNHFGSIITREPIDLPEDGYLDIDPETGWDFDGGDCQTVEEFLEKYPPLTAPSP